MFMSKHFFYKQVNLPSTNKDDVATGFVCVTPEPETCAQSANSENRTRQISLQQRLVTYYICFLWVSILYYILVV